MDPPGDEAVWFTVNVLPEPGFMAAIDGPGSNTTGSYTLSWQAVSDANRYEVREQFNGGVWALIYEGAATSINLQGLNSGNYRYKGQACNEGGCTAESAVKTVEVDLVLAIPPQLTSPTTSSDTFTISWDRVDLASSYTLQQRTDGGVWSPVYTGSATSKTVSGLQHGSYDFRVQACNAQICSEFSTAVTTQVVDAPSTSPTLSAPGSNATGLIDISWSAVIEAENYILQQRLDGESWSAAYDGSGTAYQAAVYSDGSFDFRVQACNGAGCGSWSALATTQVALAVSSETPPAPAAMPVLSAADINLADQTGVIPGEFRVDEGGAANYSIPVLALPGTAGVTPEVALEYSSQLGQGMVGHGWALKAGSQISRCRQTLASDGESRPITWSDADRFCLDGQRLVIAPGETSAYGAVGAVYHTEIESYVRVIAVGGTAGHPDYFLIEKKDGSLSRYGDAGNHESEQRAWQDAATETDLVLNWKISRFEDSVGNPMEYVYHDARDSHRLLQIRYGYGSGSSHMAAIRFVYEERPDTISGYIAGYLFEEGSRVTRIDTLGSGAPVQSLHLNYQQYAQRSFLASVEQCDGLSRAVCLPPTVFDWSQPNQGFTAHTGSRTLDGDGVVDVKMADINGDGVLDLVYLTLDQDGSSDTDHYLLYMLTANGKPQRTSFANGTGSIFFGEDRDEPVKIEIIDYNGDGRQDVAVYATRDGRWRIMLAVPQPDGSWKLDSNWINSGITDEDAKFLDVNGDGLQDAVYVKDTSSGFYQIVYRPLERDPNQSVESGRFYRFGAPVVFESCNSSGACTSSLPVSDTAPIHADGAARVLFHGDFNGDGRMDIGVYMLSGFWPPGGPGMIYVSMHIYSVSDSSKVDPFFSHQSPSDEGVRNAPIVGDLNGDGYDDLVYDVSHEANRTARYQLSNGVALQDPVIFNTSEANSDSGVYPQHIVDLDGDGRTDIAWHRRGSKNRLEYQTWDPTTGGLTPVSIAFNTGSSSTATLADLTGDGVTDLIRLGSNEVRVYPGATGSQPAFKIVRIEDGAGKITNIDYEPLSLSDHYQRITLGVSTQSSEMTINLPGGTITYPYTMSYADKDTFYSMLNGGWGLSDDEHNIGKDKPVLEFAGPVPVVTRVVSTAPKGHASIPGQVDTAATSAISYHYGEAKLQASGRGFLGFHKIRTIDEQSGVETTTTYRQDYPFIGYPQETIVERLEGEDRIALQFSRNLYDFQNWGNGHDQGPYRPVLRQVHEWKYDYSGEDLISYTQTIHEHSNGSPAYDEWGNLLSSRTTVYADYDESTGPQNILSMKSTSNMYSPTGLDPDYAKRFGRLSSTTILHSGDSATPASLRRSTFSYYTSGATKGLLKEETIQPNLNDQLTTTYSYDNFGNKIQVETVGAAGKNGTDSQARTSRSVYDALGRYIDQSITVLPSGAEHITEQVISRNSFGLPTRVRNGDEVDTYFTYGSMGRRYLSYTETGAWQSTLLLPSSHALTSAHCPAGTFYAEHVEQAGGGQSLTCYDALLRASRGAKQGFGGSWVYQDSEYDSSGRTLRQSEPYYAGSTRYWTQNHYDPIGRLLKVEHPFSTTTNETTRYSYAHVDGLNQVTITDPAGKIHRERRNALGQLVRSSQMNAAGTGFMAEVHYLYTATGELRQVTTHGADYASGVSGPVTVSMQYDVLGRKIAMSDPDKGEWTYAYNAFGELVEQTDGRGQRSELAYDRNGRMISRTDYASDGTSVLGSTSWTYDAHDSYLQPGKLIWIDHASYDKGVLEPYQQLGLYDDLGRAAGRAVLLGVDGVWMETMTYDQYGREFQRFDATGSERGLQNVYNSRGYLKGIKDTAMLGSLNMTNIYHDAGPGEVFYYEIKQMDAHGRVVEATLGNGKTIYNTYDPLQGYLSRTRAGASAPTIGTVQDLQMSYDLVGNLQHRTNHLSSRVEGFTYDHLNRLASSSVDGQLQQSLTYDGLGNIKTKSDVGTYTYAAANAGPHAVTATSIDAMSYEYDANGNLTRYKQGSAVTKELSYTSFDKPWRIEAGDHTTEFSYGSERQRYKRLDITSSGTTKTLYTGNMEWITGPGGKDEVKRYIGEHLVITMLQGRSSDVSQTRLDYLLRDHLGSVTVVLNKQGTVTNTLSFDPWGQRRRADWQTVLDMVNDWTSITSYIAVTTRGFTGHEMLDQVGLIHMNGRVYNPRLARFLSADPFVKNQNDAQMMDRYSYTRNNPLNATDPSGYFLELLLLSRIDAAINKPIFKLLADSPALSTILQIAGTAVSTYFCGPCSIGFNAQFSKNLSYAQGNDFSRAMQHAAIAGVSSAAFYGIGEYVKVPGPRMLAHGLAGGIMSELQGGKFGHGFAAAGFTALAAETGFLGSPGAGPTIDGAIRSAIVGGTASVLTGGKFANGALTGAFSYVLNHSLHAQKERPQEGKWVRAGEVAGEGSKDTFRLGHKIRIEGADDRASLHVNNSAYELTFTEIGAGGKAIPGVYPIYKGVLSSGAANALATDRVIELYGPRGMEFDWTLRINRVPRSCDNCGHPMINVYEWAE